MSYGGPSGLVPGTVAINSYNGSGNYNVDNRYTENNNRRYSGNSIHYEYRLELSNEPQ